MSSQSQTLTQERRSLIATHNVLRNTYLLLGLTLLFSGLVAGLAAANNAPYPGILLTLVGTYGLMFLTQALRNSVWGLASVFAFTGFMGYTLGPLLNFYIQHFNNGSELIMISLGGTGLIFFTLSALALTTQRNFMSLAGFLFVGVIVALIAMVANLFLHLPWLHLVLSGAFMIISSGMILMQTSAIVHGGERNYIMATISLYVALYNLFVSLLSILGALSGRD